MFHEKLKYYRKKNLLTQEDLADQLHVSRQIITKWEQGIVLPQLEYLIDLSRLFNVTIDDLVKDDDCLSLESNHIEYDELHQFLVKAKTLTYAAKKGKIESSRQGSTDYFYQQDHYSYLDSFVGSSKFSGEEVVYKDEKAIWSMNYYGRVIGLHFSGDFLKEALLHVPCAYPFRGPESYTQGEYYYHNSYVGDIEYFYGKEEIYYQNIKVYEGMYHGGILEI